MKNILGKEESLEFYNKEGKLVYSFIIDENNYCFETFKK